MTQRHQNVKASNFWNNIRNLPVSQINCWVNRASIIRLFFFFFWHNLNLTAIKIFVRFDLFLASAHITIESNVKYNELDIWYTFSKLCYIFHIYIYYMEESVLLGTKPLVDSIRHFIRDPSGVFSVCHLCECRIVKWRHDSRLLLLLNI